MKIVRINNDNAVTLKCEGCLDTAAVTDFAEAMDAVPSSVALTLDFSALDFIASSGLRVLVTTNKRLIAAGGKITLAGLNEVVADVFNVTGLDEVFEIK